MVEQVFNHSHSVVTSCKVERSGVAALQVPAVYVLGGAKLLPGRDNMTISNLEQWHESRGRIHKASSYKELLLVVLRRFLEFPLKVKTRSFTKHLSPQESS